ncbi:MAG: hypothetical protein IIA30_08530 [Myxococcales bacterium]|nr:hypothetical protein [Myxococcales bacterium]
MNGLAQLLLTRHPADARDPQAALALALEVNELSGHENLEYLDTLSLAYHLTGDTAKAIENQKKAIALLPPGESSTRKQFEAALAIFETGLKGDSDTLPAEQGALASDPPVDETRDE